MSNSQIKTPETLRSARWLGPDDLRNFGHWSRMMQLGYAEEDELKARRQKWSPPPPRFQRGWG